MANKISGHQLVAIGYNQGAILGSILKKLEKVQHVSESDLLGLLTRLRQYPENFLDDELWGDVARSLTLEAEPKSNNTIALLDTPADFAVFGREFIEQGASDQMKTALKLPVTIAGELMPDAHQGYGLPIGGVLATRNAVIPYGVGVDIGCRMALSIIDLPVDYFFTHQHVFRKELLKQTKFGAG